ncbi:HK97 family phage prohead protease [Amycolatopsis thermoflava]|uniref:HK97 family phage prohead protease n=1 Tax=Amycolatopsis thermoflava TaxID=84480 RepID=UPI00040701B9|nr:HK97 family phage prohead protease [Amycolatopsis thermoflava]
MSLAIQSSLIRSIPFTLERADDEGDGHTLEGYAAVFDTPTRIDSWEGTFDEQIQRGAFRKSIRERTPVMQFDHGRHPMIGSIPIGVINSLSEDDQGLHVVGRLSDNWLIEPVRQAIADGAVDGMSFRFEVVREEWRDINGKVIRDPKELMQLLWEPGDRGPLVRTLKEVKVAELGPVVFPAYRETTVGVRSADDAATARRDTVRELITLQTRSEESAPLGEHPDPDERNETPPDSGHVATGAPLASEHPSEPTSNEAERRRANIREVRALMRERLSTIRED